jgi:hypothetical protein
MAAKKARQRLASFNKTLEIATRNCQVCKRIISATVQGARNA